MANQLIHFECLDTGVIGVDGTPIYHQQYKIEGDPEEIFCMLCEAMTQNPSFAEWARGALSYYDNHDPETCPDCQNKTPHDYSLYMDEGVPFFEEGPFDPVEKRRCRVCGCTDEDCRGCMEKTGTPCHWVQNDLCSACVELTPKPSV